VVDKRTTTDIGYALKLMSQIAKVYYECLEKSCIFCLIREASFNNAQRRLLTRVIDPPAPVIGQTILLASNVMRRASEFV
jgi:hypothetical protein